MSAGDFQYCPTCDSHESLNGLIGYHTNQCPACNNPVFVRPFGALPLGAVFIDTLGGKFCKFCSAQAVCVEDDSAFRIGEFVSFDDFDNVMPY